MSTTTPIEDLANLSLDSQMAPTVAEVRSRATRLQDVLSAFQETVLPSEFKLQIVTNLDRPPAQRLRQTEWTISSDLEGTLLQWGAYNDKAWDFLCNLQSPTMTARAFYEKLGRRFTECFEAYDTIEQRTAGRTDPRDRVADLRSEVYKIAWELRHLAEAITEDRQYRQLGENETLEATLKALAEVCGRTTDKFALARTQRTPRRSQSSSDPGINLYDVLIRRPSQQDSEDLFLLEALEQFSPQTLSKQLDLLIHINGMLERNRAPAEYIERFEALQEKANMSGQVESSHASEKASTKDTKSPAEASSGQGRLESDPRPGSKRSAETTSSRGGGRKRGSK